MGRLRVDGPLRGARSPTRPSPVPRGSAPDPAPQTPAGPYIAPVGVRGAGAVASCREPRPATEGENG
ncbi:hypothetical protein EF910_22155 [Streptomyces sp. WAC07149]|nr:hypothetical protein EF910_22155 [Streptomyces sp. WAC07149]